MKDKKISVSLKALSELLHALLLDSKSLVNIRMTRNMKGNPISQLVKDYELGEGPLTEEMYVGLKKDIELDDLPFNPLKHALSSIEPIRRIMHYCGGNPEDMKNYTTTLSYTTQLNEFLPGELGITKLAQKSEYQLMKHYAEILLNIHCERSEDLLNETFSVEEIISGVHPLMHTCVEEWVDGKLSEKRLLTDLEWYDSIRVKTTFMRIEPSEFGEYFNIKARHNKPLFLLLSIDPI